jgi:hypothetical protein
MRIPTLAGLCVALIACETANVPAHAAWTKRNVTGLSITLIDAINVEYIAFGGHGLAIYTVGTKQLMTAPAGRWNIVNGKLCLYSDHEVIERLTLISSDGRTLIARSEMQRNKIVRFKINHGKV